MATKQWYALYTKAHREQQVHDLLSERGFAVFLPLLRVAKKGRVMQTREPLFPCYMFANFDICETGLYPVQWTQGLRSVVSFCGEPAQVDDEVIAYVKTKLGDVGPERSSRYQPGDVVRITDGPLRDLAAVFDGTLTGSGRVRVLLKVLGQQARVEVSEAWLQALA
jgi:transcriptional antiterminator RfaH